MRRLSGSRLSRRAGRGGSAALVERAAEHTPEKVALARRLLVFGGVASSINRIHGVAFVRVRVDEHGRVVDIQYQG